MPAVLRAVTDTFFIPFMNTHLISGLLFENNKASRRVCEKNGYVYVKTIPDAFEIHESKAGRKGDWVSLTVMKWSKEVS
jgi:RimJ/RimL family protein N-acetyltransferase